MSKENYAITVTGLKKAYDKNEVLKGVDFKVKQGSMLALLGPNGALGPVSYWSSNAANLDGSCFARYLPVISAVIPEITNNTAARIISR